MFWTVEKMQQALVVGKLVESSLSAEEVEKKLYNEHKIICSAEDIDQIRRQKNGQ